MTTVEEVLRKSFVISKDEHGFQQRKIETTWALRAGCVLPMLKGYSPFATNCEYRQQYDIFFPSLERPPDVKSRLSIIPLAFLWLLKQFAGTHDGFNVHQVRPLTRTLSRRQHRPPGPTGSRPLSAPATASTLARWRVLSTLPRRPAWARSRGQIHLLLAGPQG